MPNQSYEDLTEWKSGTGRVLRVGDLCYQNGTISVLFRIHGIRRFETRTEVSVTHSNGKRKGTWRTFLVDDLHQVRSAKVEVR